MTDLRVELAKRLGWTQRRSSREDGVAYQNADESGKLVPSLVWISPEGKNHGWLLPDLSALVRTAEGMLTEEQLGEYARRLAINHPTADPVYYLNDGLNWRSSKLFWQNVGWLLIASNELKAAALCEVMT